MLVPSEPERVDGRGGSSPLGPPQAGQDPGYFTYCDGFASNLSLQTFAQK
jgi:hypothetical protein